MSLEDTAAAPAAPTDQTGAPAAPAPVPAPDAAAKGQGAETTKPLADGGGASDDVAKVEPTWRDDWRERMAGGDDKFLSHLKRYTSPENYAKAGYEAQQRIRQGAVRDPLPEKPTEEQLAAYRKDNGIPDKPEAYEVKPSNGYVFGEADQPMIESFKKFAHERNWTPSQVNQGADFVAQLSEENIARQQEADLKFQTESQDRLRMDWGGDYRRNINIMQNFLDGFAPNGLKDRLLGARLADGRLFGDDPDAMSFLLRAAMEANPAATVVPAGERDPGKNIEDEIGQLKTLMGDRSGEYWQGPNAEKNQARYRELLQTREKLAKRA